MMLKSVIHPSVKSLECIRYSAHPNLLDYYKVEYSNLIYNALPLLQGLKELRLGPANRSKDMKLDVSGFRDTLEKFSSHSCEDSDIETLAENCEQLKCLDISGSRSLTNRCVEYILQFEHLEELNLSEVCSLSQDDLIYILNSLADVEVSKIEASRNSSADCPGDPPKKIEPCSADTSCSPVLRSQLLKSFGCMNATKRHIAVIAKFSNLTSLSLSYINGSSLTPLKDLKNLQNLFLQKSRFFLVRKLLIAIGNQLKCLNLINVVGTDFSFVSKYCRSLECLHLWFTKINDLRLPVNYLEPGADLLPDPAFPTVESLQLFTGDVPAVKYILSRFKNVEKLFMESTCNDVYFDLGIECNRLPNVKEIFWGHDVVIQFHEDHVSIRRFYRDGPTSCVNEHF
jgi:hypothetical protein